MGLGDSLKNWARSKAEELVTADSSKREDAAASTAAAEAQAKSDVGETLLRAAFPKLGELADRQTAGRAEKEAAEERERQEEIAALPLAAVQLTVTGHVSGSWSGELHLAWNLVEAVEEPDPTDPYADRPLVWVELFAADGAEPDLGGLHLTHWAFQLPGWHGDGTYDLTAIAREREAAGAALDYLEWALDFAEAEDAAGYFHPGAAQSSITVSEDGQRLDGSVSTTGALGELTVVASIRR